MNDCSGCERKHRNYGASSVVSIEVRILWDDKIHEEESVNKSQMETEQL
jgi:hypothetical protein